ncbi:MAG: membrane protein insertion efficiency factor YidD [Ruminococcaceae bacterium]|nr:membrane protein insertion efficiency factor YidD [Oscillospiraceae bacterium]
MNILQRGAIKSIRFYQKHISSRTAPCCRFEPTCSAYTLEAIRRFGFFRGTGMGMWRIMRCNPWNKGGYDPVPEKKEKCKKHDCNHQD